MTDNQLKPLCANNTRCDGIHCIDSQGKVHIIPLDRDNSAHLCRDCYEEELRFNEQLELDGKVRVLPPLPFDTYPALPQEN